jgi:hypothetical protein
MLERPDPDDAAVLHLREESAPMGMVADQLCSHAACSILKRGSLDLEKAAGISSRIIQRIDLGRKVAWKPALGE